MMMLLPSSSSMALLEEVEADEDRSTEDNLIAELVDTRDAKAHRTKQRTYAFILGVDSINSENCTWMRMSGALGSSHNHHDGLHVTFMQNPLTGSEGHHHCHNNIIIIRLSSCTASFLHVFSWNL